MFHDQLHRFIRLITRNRKRKDIKNENINRNRVTKSFADLTFLINTTFEILKIRIKFIFLRFSPFTFRKQWDPAISCNYNVIEGVLI